MRESKHDNGYNERTFRHALSHNDSKHFVSMQGDIHIIANRIIHFSTSFIQRGLSVLHIRFTSGTLNVSSLNFPVNMDDLLSVGRIIKHEWYCGILKLTAKREMMVFSINFIFFIIPCNNAIFLIKH